MPFNRDQIITLSRYLSDLSKILFASTVIAFFVPAAGGLVSMPIFVSGLAATILSLFASLKIIK